MARHWSTLATIVVLCSACPGSGVGGPSKPDGAAFDGFNADVTPVFACDTVDILFVIDNSNSMEQEQTDLIKNFPGFIKRIEQIKPAIKSYHVGVISTDLGAGPKEVGTCKPDGDQGKLQHLPRGTGCKSSYPLYLSGPGSDLAADFACIAALGLGGCGYEQQLEAALKALQDQPANQGFLRTNAPLAIVFVSDEDDCSAQDQGLFDDQDTNLGPLPTRCVRLTQMLHPVSRYVNAFKAIKGDPKRVVVAAITGPAGQVVIDETLPGGVKPACTSTALGTAAPGNRFAELVQAFGERGVQRSLCDGDLAPALDVVGQAIERACLKIE